MATDKLSLDCHHEPASEKLEPDALFFNSTAIFENRGQRVAYKKLEDLPEPVRNVLLKHAQKIYLAAFNNAWSEYKKPKDRRGSASREEVAHKVAWSAVKRKYEKSEGKRKKK